MKLSSQIHNFLKEYVIQNNKLPTVSIVCGEFKLPHSKAIENFRILKDKDILILNSSRYKIGKHFFSENGKQKKEIKELISSITIIVIRIIMGVISVGACILSTWFTANFLMDSLGLIFSYILSIIMILFSVISFEAIIIFYKNKQLALVFLFSFLWLIVLIFSMFSTVATQYNERIKTTNQSNKESAGKLIDRTTYNRLIDQEKQIKESIQLKKAELQPYLNIMNSFKTKEDRKDKDEKWTYWNAQEQIKKINKDIQKLKTKLDEKEEDIQNELARLQEKKDKSGIVEGTTKSFYLWLSEIFKIDIQYVQFWPSTFPAVFIDIIAPLALAICMFLKKKGEKK